MVPTSLFRKFSWTMGLIFILLLAALLAANFIAFEYERQNLIDSTQEQLLAVTDLKVQQISTWLDERLGDAQLISHDTSLGEHAESLLNPYSSLSDRQEFLAMVDHIRSDKDYLKVALVSPQGNILVSTPQEMAPLAPDALRMVSQAAKTDRVVFSDFQRYPNEQSTFLDYFVPLHSSPTLGPVKTVLILRVDPHDSLFTLVQAQTTTNATSESYLISVAGESLFYVSELREDQQASLVRQVSTQPGSLLAGIQPDLPADLIEGVDYRGVPVLGIARQITGTPWILLSQEDRQAINAPLNERQRGNLILTGLILFAYVLTGTVLWRKRESAFYKQEYQSEAARQVLNAQLSNLTRYANDMILLMDQDWHILEANDRALENYGYTAEDIRRLSIRDLQSEATDSDLAWQVDMLQSQDGVIFETIHRRKDTTTFPVEVSSRIIKTAGQVFFQSIIRDITERRLAEQELRESERRFRAFYEQAPVGYQSLDEEGRFIEVNRAWLKLMGYSMREVLGRFFGEYLDTASQARFDRAFEELKATGQISGEEFEMICKSGIRVVAAMYGKATYDEIGHIKQIHCILHDITEQRLAKEKIHRLNEELEQRVLSRTSQLEAANRELEAFSYSISHDLRAPLRAIDGFSRILVEDYKTQLDPDAQHYLERIQENTRTMSNLIDSLLAFSRLSRQPLNKQTIDPKLLVDQTLEMLLGDSPPPNRTITVMPLPACQADPALLKQVFTNLISNAIKFSAKREHPLVEIGYLNDNGVDIYYVRDNGVGFDMAYANKLFGVFQRLHRAEDFDGTGVGLAIVQRIIHRHGGKIWAMSEPDQGATFCFTLEENHGDH